MPITESLDSLKVSYDDVTALYDAADELIGSINEAPLEEKASQFSLINSLVEQLEESTDVLSEEFVSAIEENKKDPSRSRKKRVELAFRKIYAALDIYRQKADELRATKAKAVIERVQPVIERVKRFVERAVSAFIGIVEISLDHIMHKVDLESLRRNEEKVAHMLHTASLNLGKSN